MPLLWKKVKGTKISQLFSESQRRRGHLVVETGFSTSLVDLFVKNRDRLKKPNSSNKKKKKKQDQIMDDNSSLVFSSPSPSSSPLIPRAPCSSPLLFNQGISSCPLPPPVVAVDGGLKETDERPNTKGVLGALLWMFFVVIIALWTKRFAVGLTMSALLLFFVEFIRKKTYRFMEPCSGVKRRSRLRLLMQSIFQVITISFFRRNESFDEIFIVEEEEEERNLGSHGNSNCEIMQIASEPMLTVDGCIQELPLLPVDISEPKKKGKRAKMKSKIKRLFKGGSSSSKKEKRNHLETEERIVPILEDPNQNGQKCISRTSTSTNKLSSSLISTTTQEDEVSTISSMDEENLDGIVTGEEEREGNRRSSMVMITVIMCVIVLVGLTVGGKFLAMAFLVFWFLMLKSGDILKRYIHTYEKQTHTD